MLLGDSTAYLLQIGLALYFLTVAFCVPNELPDTDSKNIFPAGLIYTYVRSLVFLLVSAFLFGVLAFESTLLSNCSGTFGQCFNSGSWVVTSTVIPSSYSLPLTFLFGGLALIFAVVGLSTILFQQFGYFLFRFKRSKVE